MLYNQNNVATEASAVTTAIEQEVGEDLCKMLQFRSHVDGFDKTQFPHAWGHITSCGSVANFEGAWAARSMFYLLSLPLPPPPPSRNAPVDANQYWEVFYLFCFCSSFSSTRRQVPRLHSKRSHQERGICESSRNNRQAGEWNHAALARFGPLDPP